MVDFHRLSATPFSSLFKHNKFFCTLYSIMKGITISVLLLLDGE